VVARRRVHLRHLDRADRAGHRHRHPAEPLLEGLAGEVRPVGREMEPVLVVVGEPELFGVDAVVHERRGDLAARPDRLHDAD
jgi:hypothetical protein